MASQTSAVLHSSQPAPTGTTVLLFAGAGGDAPGFDVTFSDIAAMSIADARPAVVTNTVPLTYYTSADVPRATSYGFVTSTLVVTGGPAVITDVNLIDLSGSHPHLGDVTFALQSPAGTTAEMLEPVPTCGVGLSFDGADDYVAVSSVPQPDPYQITVEAWIKADTWSNFASSGVIAGKSDNYNSSYNGYSLRVGDGGRVAFGLGSGQVIDQPEVKSSQYMSTGVWYHVAGTYDGSALRVYVNGEQFAETAYTGEIKPATRPFYIGRDSYIINHLFDGMIAEVRLWNVARSSAELQATMYRRLSGSEPGLVGYWPLSEGSGTVTYDYSGNNYVGYLLGWSTKSEPPPTWVPGESVFDFSLDDEVSPAAGVCPTTPGAAYHPRARLAAFNGEDSNGTWTLIVTDTRTLNDGDVQGWGLAFNDEYITTLPITGTYRPIEPLSRLYNLPLDTVTLAVADTMTDGQAGVLQGWGLTSTGARSHVYTWDVLGSGILGLSQDTRFRIDVAQATTGTGPFQYPVQTAQTLPFRVRGNQIRVMRHIVSDAQTLTVPAENAIVYRLPAGQTGEYVAYQESLNTPWRTNAAGYLRGQDEINVGDRLIALVPITETDSYTLYHTNAPISSSAEVGGAPVVEHGVQSLVVSEDNPLLLFNLDMSLEWDARNDGDFLEDLEYAIQQASAVLYDVSDGQAALGEVRLYHNKENWVSSDIVIYAQNGIRPRASMGGVADELTDDLGLTGVITNAYGPGQVRMGPNWDPFGESLTELSVDWQRALAHELAHYLLYLPDNYLGVVNGIPVSIDCKGSFMTSTYDEAYSEFLTSSGWLDPCTDSVAAHTTGRTDWETIQRFYAMLHQPGATNAGPSTLPLAVTSVKEIAPPVPAVTFAPLYFDLRDAVTQDLLPVPKAYGYLFKTQGTEGVTDDTVIALGATVGDGDRIKVRGAEAGDRLCVFGPYDEAAGTAYAGCLPALAATNRSVPMDSVADWQPVIIVQAITSRTLHITATLAVSESALQVQVFPAYGAPGAATLVAPAAAMEPVGTSGRVFAQVLTLDAPAFEGFARVWVPGGAALREALSQFYLSPPWGPNNRPGISNADRRAWGANQRQLGAPVASGDGQVTIFNLEDIFAETGTVSLQALNDLPELPGWFTVVGQGYRFVADTVFPRVLNFDYLQRDVPDGYEYTLAIYYRAEGGSGWQRLPTTVDVAYNRASARMPDNGVNSQGIYALIATVELPSFSPGWNLFGYPIPETRPVTVALASLGDGYASVYGYDDANGVWRLYDRTVPPAYAGLVNDLTQLEFGVVYWLSATRTITGYLGVPQTMMATAGSQTPPATYYGPVLAGSRDSVTAGLPVTAWVDGAQCGSTETVAYQDGVYYVLHVEAACAAPGALVHFDVGGQRMATTARWDNNVLHWLPQAALYRVYLPVVNRTQ
jgi:hypothetical protein